MVAGVLILTGFMGAGKSAVGRELARRLGWRFVDLDREIEALAGKPVPRIFAEEGEGRFRALETEALRRVLGGQRTVVATGGGVLTREENRDLLARHLTVNLLAPVDVCVARVMESGEARPLLEGTDPLGAARRLWREREHLYRSVPRQVDTAGRDPGAVAEEILRRYGAEFAREMDPGEPG